MPAAASATASAPASAKRVVGRPFRPGVSGNPGGKPRRQHVLFEAIAAEFGGASALTAMEREYIARAADQLRRAERAKNSNANVRLTRCADQLIGRVRDMRRERQRKPAGPTLAEYVASKTTAGTTR
jgi:hypothetical protein